MVELLLFMIANVESLVTVLVILWAFVVNGVDLKIFTGLP